MQSCTFSRLGRFACFPLGFALSTLAFACGDSGGNDCRPGTEACVCNNGASCFRGLTCVSGVCVDLPGGDDDGDNDGDDGGAGHDTGDTGDTGDTDDPGGSDDWNACLALLECVRTVDPATLSSLATAYGPDGSCYDISGVTKEDCWAECEALRKTYAEDNLLPECAPFSCGDGILDPHEMCDAITEDSCNAHCELWEHDCNPLTQLECDTDSQCIADTEVFSTFPEGGQTLKYLFRCVFAFPGDLGMHENCWGDGICSAEFPACGSGAAMPQCNHEMCCTQYCARGPSSLDADCPEGYSCQPLSGAFPGFEWVKGVEGVGVCL